MAASAEFVGIRLTQSLKSMKFRENMHLESLLGITAYAPF